MEHETVKITNKKTCWRCLNAKVEMITDVLCLRRIMNMDAFKIHRNNSKLFRAAQGFFVCLLLLKILFPSSLEKIKTSKK